MTLIPRPSRGQWRPLRRGMSVAVARGLIGPFLLGFLQENEMPAESAPGADELEGIPLLLTGEVITGIH